ncbi:hypothetical protein H4R24_003630 [Coemansia sp. RSA 988]|nr:hypothetical protein H4R24_003630 [Coemansia sp. RSA 988]
MSASGSNASGGDELSDCTYCQRVTRDACKDQHIVDLDSQPFYSRARSGIWSIANEGCWQFFVAFVRQTGFEPWTDSPKDICPILPSSASIAVAGVLSILLKREMNPERFITHGPDANFGRVLVILQSLTWLSRCHTNRRVLFHHGIVAHVCKLLALVRSSRVDVISHSAISAHRSHRDKLATTDIRGYKWWEPSRSANDAITAVWAASARRGSDVSESAARPGIEDAIYDLFQHTAYLCTQLFDPDRHYEEFVLYAGMLEPAANLGILNLQESPSCVLSEVLLIWKQIRTTCSRQQFSPAIPCLCSITGCLFASGLIDGQNLRELDAVGRISQAMDSLELDEAYICWRLLTFALEWYPDASKWCTDLRPRFDHLWHATAERPIEHLCNYEAFGILASEDQEHNVEPDAHSNSLKQLYSYQHDCSFSSRYSLLRHDAKVHNGSTDTFIKPAVLAQYIGAINDPFPESRLRRAMDTVIAAVARRSMLQDMPAWILDDLDSIHRTLLSMTLATSSGGQNGRNTENEGYDGAAAKEEAFVLEYALFLWRLWQLPLRHNTLRVVFRTISVAVWDRLLVRLRIVKADASATEHGTVRTHHAENILQHVASVAAWLVAYSDVSSSNAGKVAILDPPTYKLVFSRLAEAMQESAAGLWARDSGCAGGFFAAQALAFICWQNMTWFRQLLHETQSIGFILDAIYRLRDVDENTSPTDSSGSLDQSLANLSVVSLPDESMYNITGSLRFTADHPWRKQFLCLAMFLLRTSIADLRDSFCVGEVISSSKDLRKIQAVSTDCTTVLYLVWQLCHVKLGSRDVTIDCIGALQELSAGHSLVVGSYAMELATTLLSWLLFSALCNDADIGDMVGDVRDRLSEARKWSKAVVSWITPAEIGTTASIQQHTTFLTQYRGCLADAALATASQKSCVAIGAMAVAHGALEDVLALIQLAAIIDPLVDPASSQLSAKLEKGVPSSPEHRRVETNVCVGMLACEAMRLVAFLIHGNVDHTAHFASIGGYRITHTCTTRIAQHTIEASAPVAKGVMALLTGVMDASTRRTWIRQKIDRHWIPTLVALYPKLPLLVCISILRIVAQWSEESSSARWWWSQSTIVRLSVERLQMLLSEVSTLFALPADRRDCVSSYMNHLQSMLVAVMGMSTNASDVKLLLRTLVSGIDTACDLQTALPSLEAAEYTAAVRRMLSDALIKCAQGSTGQNYFAFDGSTAFLSQPYFRRISERGFTFSAWVRSHRPASESIRQHLLPVGSFGVSSAASSGVEGLCYSPPALSQVLASDDVNVSNVLGTVLHLTCSGDSSVLIEHDRVAQGLTLQIVVDGAHHLIRCAEGRIDPGHWHSLTFCYAPAKRGWSPFGASNIHIYLDGIQVYKGSHPYINHATYRACHIGGRPVSDSDTQVQRTSGSFAGHIAAVRMFDGVLRTSEIELLHHLGPAHATQLRRSQAAAPGPHEATLLQTSGTLVAASRSTSLRKDITGLFVNGELEGRLILALDSSASDGRTCDDLSAIGICQSIARSNARNSHAPATEAAGGPGVVSRATSKGAGQLLTSPADKVRMEEASRPWLFCGSVLAIEAVTIHRLLHSLGGVESVLVFLQHLDWLGAATRPAMGPLGSDEGIFDQRVLECMPLPSFFYFLRDLIRGDPRHLLRIQSFNMVPLLARVLQQRDDLPSHLTMAALRAMQAFQAALDSQGGRLPAVYADVSSFWSQVQQYLILNLRIWRQADVDTQLLYLNEMQRQLCIGRVGDEHGKRCNATVGVCGKSTGDSCLGIRWILYALFNYYPYDATQHMSQQRHQTRLRAQSLSTRPSTPGIGDSDVASVAARSFTEPPIEPAEEESQANDINVDDANGDMPGFPNLSRSETKLLRRVLLHTLELFLTASEEYSSNRVARGVLIPAVRKTDMLHLIRHLLYACNRDTEHTREILALLFRCLADGSANASDIASQVIGLQGLDTLTHIIECDDNGMAAEAINIVVLLSTMGTATREHSSTASRITSSLRGRTRISVDDEDVTRMLALVRTKRALTPLLYRSLLLMALQDHAALLASINIDPAPSEAARNPAARRVRHIRDLSTSQSVNSSVHVTDCTASDTQESFVTALPSRLIKDPRAWGAILELSCAPGTDPAIRIIVLKDLRRLLEDEPANFDHIGLPQQPLLDRLMVIVVLGGCISDERDENDGAMFSGHLQRLSDSYARAMGHLELVPHTTLDYYMQNLAVGHIRARKMWVRRRIEQLRETSDDLEYCDSDDLLLVRAQTELMAFVFEWSQEAMSLMQLLVCRFFSTAPEYAKHMHQAVVTLWALTPTGSVPLAVQLLSMVMDQARMQLADISDMLHPAVGEWVLPHSLALLSSLALDILLNYRQFQEYVAYHHENLKVLSVSSSPAAKKSFISERDAAYQSQHSPWDGMPELTRSLAEFMLELGTYNMHLPQPICEQILCLAVSGIRSAQLQRVEETLHLLVQLLQRHPSLADASLGSPRESFGPVCRGDCVVAQRSLAVLGYVHEAFMFAQEQVDQQTHSNEHMAEGCARASVCENIGRQYMVVFQCLRAHLYAKCPQILASMHLETSLDSDEQSLDWEWFLRLVGSTEWGDLYRTQLMPAMRGMEEEEMEQAASSQARFASVLHAFLVRSQKTGAQQMREVKGAQTSVASNTLPIEADEASAVRIDDLSKSFGRWSQVWRRRLQLLSAPRGPWQAGHSIVNPVRFEGQHWIIDPSENKHRMRRRLIQNVYWESHSLAADRRDKTGQRRAPKSQRQTEGSGFGSDEDAPHLSLSVSGIDSAEGRIPGGDEDEEWNLVTPEDLSVVAAATETGASHFCIPGERIALLGVVHGQVELSQSLLRFVVERDTGGRACIRGADSTDRPTDASNASGHNSKPAAADGDIPRAIYAELNRDLSWPLSDIQQIHFRRFMMRNSAIEVFFRDRTSILLNIPSKKTRMQLVWKLTSLPKVNQGLSLSDIRPPGVLVRRLRLTERWQRGELSNFDYLMALNTAAGRSYNDLSQYPVFPWIIRDYSSKWLDLRSSKTYRDLSRPIGALNEKRLRHFLERYESFEDPTGRIKKFLYGTHYSSAATVAHYLLRAEPFTSVHVLLQSGKFDHADRQFHSIGDAWNSCMTGSGDVKELIPEFFYMPEFLTNHNRLNLGKRQDGTRLNDVKLPPWAATPEEFIHINRQALESDYVSATLHKWIDLIFGYKQRGAEAAKAHNVFYYLTYEGAVNIDAVQDPMERASIESQIHYFGQTPTQLFTEPHPARHVRTPDPHHLSLTAPSGTVQQFTLQVSSSDIAFVGSSRHAALVSPRGVSAAIGPVLWPSLQPCHPSVLPPSTARGSSDLSGQRQLISGEVVTIVDIDGRVYVYDLTLFTSEDRRLQLAVDPAVEGYCVLTAASPPSSTQRLVHALGRPTSYATIPEMPGYLVTCAHLDSTVRRTRLTGKGSSIEPDPGLLQHTTSLSSIVLSASRSIGMTNAYACAAVSVMSNDGGGSGHSLSSTDKMTKQDMPKSSMRALAGLFGGGSGSAGTTAQNQHSTRRNHSATTGITDEGPTAVAADPSTYIPLAARLLDPINESSCTYIPDPPSCVDVTSDGMYAVVGSSQGTVAVLVGEAAWSASRSRTGSAALFDSDAGLTSVNAPLLFATGMADPMNPNVGHTSMAAYTSGSVRGDSEVLESVKAGLWAVHHILHGHDSAVLDAAIDVDHDLVASGASDGTVILWTAKTGQYLHTLFPTYCDGYDSSSDDFILPFPRSHLRYSRIERVLISVEALVVCYSVSGATDVGENYDKLDPARSVGQSAMTMLPLVSGGGPAMQETRDNFQLSNNSTVASSDCDINLANRPGYIDGDAAEVGALHVYGINGRRLRTRRLVHCLRDMALTPDGKYGACVSTDSRVAVFEVNTLGVVRQFELPSCGCSVAWSGTSNQQLIVGCDGGRVVVISVDHAL